jgi:serine/threonine protein kinase
MDHNEFRERYQYDSEKDLLGQGGFGRVYRARDVLLDRWVALKIFSRDVPQQYNLISEIRRAIDLNHKNICKYYGAELLRGTDALGETQVIQVGVMELVSGGTVGDFLKRSPEFRKKLLMDVLQGLSYLHHRQPSIIHRDLKPPNVLVGYEDGVPVAKVTDFGISKAASVSGTDPSQLGLGTFAYMAPEQLNPLRYGVNGKIQCNLDLWAFGAMTIELLTGKLPFGGDGAASTGEILESIVRGIPPEVMSGFEEPYQSVLRRCMIQDAGKRAQSADELLTLFDGTPQVPVAQRKETVIEVAGSRPETVVDQAGSPWIAPATEPADVQQTVPVLAQVEPAAGKLGKRVWTALTIVATVAVCALWWVSSWDTQPQETQAPSTQPASPGDSNPPAQDSNAGSAADKGLSANKIDAQAKTLNKQGHPAEARPLFEKACTGGSKDACNRLGVMYLQGDGGSKDYAQALTFFSKACNAGSGDGCDNLGYLYEKGNGVPVDSSKASTLYARALTLYAKNCDAGDASECAELGYKYQSGDGVATDNSQAATLYSKACSGGDAGGCYMLGSLYHSGVGVEKDAGKEKLFLGKACQMGDDRGCHEPQTIQ